MSCDDVGIATESTHTDGERLRMLIGYDGSDAARAAVRAAGAFFPGTEVLLPARRGIWPELVDAAHEHTTDLIVCGSPRPRRYRPRAAWLGLVEPPAPGRTSRC